MSKWEERKINTLGVVSRGRSRHRPRDDKALYGGNYPFIQTGDVKTAEFYLNKFTQTYNNYGLSQSKLWGKGTLCITIAANIAETAILKIGACFPDSIVGFIPFSDKADVRFIKYSFDMLKKEMQAASLGATQDNFSVEKMLKFKFIVPDLATQKRIADVLSAYDDLIENNNRRIELLEKAAQDLYKEWFVRFRFPGHETAKFQNGLPEGWEVKRLLDVLIVKYGKDHKSIPNGDIPILGSGGVMRYGNRSLYEKESVLIPRKGSLNNVMYMNEPFWTVDTMFYTEPQMPFAVKYLFYVLSQIDMQLLNAGAALPSMTTDILYHLKIIFPSANLLKIFDNKIEHSFKQIKRLQTISKNLKKQRDLLLPRLMSGKLEV